MNLTDIETMQHTQAAVDYRLDCILQTQALCVKRGDAVIPVLPEWITATYCFDYVAGELVIDGRLRENAEVTFNTIRVPLELFNCDDETFHRLLNAHVAKQKLERDEAERAVQARAKADKTCRYQQAVAVHEILEAERQFRNQE